MVCLCCFEGGVRRRRVRRNGGIVVSLLDVLLLCLCCVVLLRLLSLLGGGGCSNSLLLLRMLRMRLLRMRLLRCVLLRRLGLLLGLLFDIVRHLCRYRRNDGRAFAHPLGEPLHSPRAPCPLDHPWGGYPRWGWVQVWGVVLPSSIC